jgi:hypothetical protein
MGASRSEAIAPDGSPSAIGSLSDRPAECVHRRLALAHEALQYRRTMLRPLLLALAAAASSQAADERADRPGWYRTQIGRFIVTALWDGTRDLPIFCSA